MSQFYIFYCRINQRWKASWNMVKIFKFSIHFSPHAISWVSMIHFSCSSIDIKIFTTKGYAKIFYLAYFKEKTYRRIDGSNKKMNVRHVIIFSCVFKEGHWDMGFIKFLCMRDLLIRMAPVSQRMIFLRRNFS